MRNRLEIYRLWRLVSIAVMSVAITVVVAEALFAPPAVALPGAEPTTVCSQHGIRFCLVLPPEGGPFLSPVSYGHGQAWGFA